MVLCALALRTHHYKTEGKVGWESASAECEMVLCALALRTHHYKMNGEAELEKS
jgi:hypothetical protein